MTHPLFEGLNARQREAVDALDGPLLVLAGAGTGKTRVLISRMVNLIVSERCKADQILAVTFTNKAAQEMRNRLGMAVGDITGMWLGTFHSICVRLLRIYCKAAGLEQNFVIIDDDERNKVIKQIAFEAGIDDKRYPLKLLSFILSSLKEKGVNYYDVDKVTSFKYRDLDVVNFYKNYQEKLKFYNLVDFDDLILYTVNLLKSNKEILSDLHEKFPYILVDEYQDTGSTQDTFLRLLASKYFNICCVGDEDQSIYSWRGADVGNILNFGKSFPNAQIIRLEQNYRSTPNIIKAAGGVILNNKSRYGKTLVSEIPEGAPVEIVQTRDGAHEGDVLVKKARDFKDKGVGYGEMAVLVRASFQMRSIEEALIRAQLPYKIIDGIKFYDRKEIKDLVAYLRVVYSNTDQPAFERIINVPRRGIGDKSLDLITQYSKFNHASIIASAQAVLDTRQLPSKAHESLKDLLQYIYHWRSLVKSEEYSIARLLETIANQSGYVGMLEREIVEDTGAKNRLDNIKEFIASLQAFTTIDEFLEHIALFSGKNTNDEEEAINIMTIHAAKGLEYDTVFLPGWDEGVFPSHRSLEEGSEDGLEEERRLAYVAITRAKKHLTILHAQSRLIYGKWQDCMKSRFIKEILSSDSEGLVAVQNLCSENFRYSDDRHPNQVNDDEEFESVFSSLEKRMGKGAFGGQSSGKSFSGQKSAGRISSTPYSSGRAGPAVGALENKDLVVNDRVDHSTLGLGLVTKVNGPFIEVTFDDGGKRLIHANYLKKAE